MPRNWRDLPTIIFWIYAIEDAFKDHKFTPKNKEEERDFVNYFIRHNIRNFMKHSFLYNDSDIEKEITRIGNAWFLEKYIRTKGKYD